MQQKMNNRDQYSVEFLDLNREAINELATFAQIYEGFTLAFAEVNFVLDVQVLLKALKDHHRCQDIQFVVIEITDSELEFVLTELKEGLQQTTIEPNKKIVIVVLGLERAIGFVKTEKTPEVLDNLNFARNAFTEQLPYPVIFVLTDYALTRLARGARDFWAWASAVIAFRSGRQTIEQAHQQVLEPRRLFSNDAKPVKQERIDILLRLLTQYQPTLGKPDAEVAPLRLNILEELADAYCSLSSYQKAQYFYTETLNLAQEIDKKRTQAKALLGLGNTLSCLGDYDDALKNYDQTLVIYKSLDDRLGEANSLKEIGDVLHLLDQHQEALNRYKKALELYKVTDSKLGEANTLKAVGDVLRLLDQRQEALNRYEQARTLYKIVGDRLGEATALHAIGDTLDFLNKHQEALDHYDAALKIFQDLGNDLGEANTLIAIGDVLQFLGQHQEALNRYNESLKLFKDVGDRLGEANALKAIGDALLQKEDLDEATLELAATNIETAYKLYCDLGNRYSQGRILLTSVVPLYLHLGQRIEALSMLTEAAKVTKEIESEPMQQLVAHLFQTLEQEQT